MIFMVFFQLSTFELNDDKQIQHMITADVSILDTEVEKYVGESAEHKAFHKKIQADLHKHVEDSYLLISGSFLIALFLALVLSLIVIYLRKLKSIKHQQLLEELLYYDQLDKLCITNNSEFSTTMKALHVNRETFLNELQHGLAENQFILYFQPLVHAKTNEINDVEALVRWQHPIHGLLTPDMFLPYCEHSGFIVPLGEWIFQSAYDQLNQWHKMGFTTLSISINLSNRQLTDENLLHFIKKLIQENKELANFIKIEINENSIMDDLNATIPILKSLREMGIQLSLDDFGTAYSSLNFLKQLPISNIKLDKAFIHDITSNITSLGIVESIINLGKSLGLTITAEGVENISQLHLMKKLNCDYIQGYLFSKPVAEKDMTHLLQVSNTNISQLHHISSNELNVQCEILSETHYKEAVNIITETFTNYEPMTKYLGITPQQFLPFAQLIVEKAIQDKLSIVSIDDNKVTACTIVEDIADPLNIAIHLDPRFKIIFSLLANLAEDFFKERVLTKGQIAHLFITAVDKKYFGSGLSKKINFESIKLAKEKNFDFMCCEFTHDYNEKGTVKNIKNNKLLIRGCQYKDFIFDGKKPFENLEGAANAYIWELREGAQLKYQMKSYTL